MQVVPAWTPANRVGLQKHRVPICDFAPCEDGLKVRLYSQDTASITIIDANDGRYTDVETAFSDISSAHPETAVIRQQSTTGVNGVVITH